MKKLTITSLILFSTLFCFAQNSIGVRVGINLANQQYDADGLDLSFDSNLGFSIAIPFEIGLSDNFSVQPELAFIQKGVKQDGIIDEVEVKTILNYLEVPILAKKLFKK